MAFEAVDVVTAVWDRLPLKYRHVLQEKYMDGKSTADLAERDGRTPKAIEGLLTRARKAFRRAYRDVDEEKTRTDRTNE